MSTATETKTQQAPEMSKVRILVECALMIAIGTVLAQIKIYTLPNEGSVTAVSMLPFILISFRHGVKWGALTGFANSVLQMLLGGLPPTPAGTLLALGGMILLDYVIAFTQLGFAQTFAKPFGDKHRLAGILTGTVAVCFIRYLCSFLSGVLIWSVYAPESMGPVWYSLTYNASYMLPETILTVLAAALLYKALPKLFSRAV